MIFRTWHRLLLASLTLACAYPAFAASLSPITAKKPALSMPEFLTASPAPDWQALDPENTVYFDIESGRVVMLLAPTFAPAHVANIKSLVRAHFFDGLEVVRVQDNYVAQWGDVDSKHERGADFKKPIPDEYFRRLAGLPFVALPDQDAYAPQTGFSLGFPVAQNPRKQQAWLTHCYGMVGVGRDLPPSNGEGEELYAVIGHAPRHLDRNLAIVGRIVQGIDLLSSLPRGTGTLGFYEKDQKPALIKTAEMVADLPNDQRLQLEALRTDSATFKALIEMRRNRRDPFFVEPTGHIDVCNMPLPVRIHPSS